MTLKDEECTEKLLEVRQIQLEYSLKMEEWTDAFRTSEIIFYLINRREKHSTKQILESFFTNLAEIFWKSENHLFHSYTLQNLLKIVRTSNTRTAEEKLNLACQLILSSLSVPLNNKVSNFHRLSTAYQPKDMQENIENSAQVRQEILNVSQMLQIQGIPSRNSLINQINLKNQFVLPTCPAVASLFKLIEFESSPFAIAKQGPALLKTIIEAFPKLDSYVPLIKRTLAIRILQKSKAFYTTIKFDSLIKQLAFYGDWK